VGGVLGDPDRAFIKRTGNSRFTRLGVVEGPRDCVPTEFERRSRRRPTHRESMQDVTSVSDEVQCERSSSHSASRSIP